MYAVLRMARRCAPLVIGSVLLVIALIYGIGSVLTEDGSSLPPARVVFLGIAGLVLIATGIVHRRSQGRRSPRQSEPRRPG